MGDIIELYSELFLSYSYLTTKGVKYGTVLSWSRGDKINTLKIEGKAFIAYNSIPAPTRAKLPSESELLALLNQGAKDKEVERVHKILQYAQTRHFDGHRQHYRKVHGIGSKRAMECGMLHATVSKVLEMYMDKCNGPRGGVEKGWMDTLFRAVGRLYPDKWSDSFYFSKVVSKALKLGVEAVVMDGRAMRTSVPNQRYDERHHMMLRAIASSGKAYKGPDVRKKMTEMCGEMGLPVPSERWVRAELANLKKYQPEIRQSRYGKDAEDKQTPYMSLIPALHAGDQYQVDGWNTPFYYMGTNSSGAPRLKNLVLVAVKDAYSQKIVGYSMAESENRLSLFEALHDAIGSVGALPFELLTDNHSYNQTGEVETFRQEAEKIGMTWTVDSNPQRKSIVERGFKDVGERFCKEHYGYIGQGIRTRDRDGRTKQELIDKYQSSGKILDVNEIRMILVKVVSEYNATPLNGKGKSPDRLFEESTRPSMLALDTEDRLRLFSLRAEYKVTRGQLNITIAGTKHEYQLNAETHAKWNNRKVAVRYESPELVYLFDPKDDSPICSLRHKRKAHGALANQTPEDIDLMNRHKGMLSGIKAQARRDNEELAKRAAELEPGIYDIINRHTTPKDMVQAAREDAEYRQHLIRRGIDPDAVPTVPKESEVGVPAFLGRERTGREKSPIAVKNHVPGIIDLDDI